MRVSVEKPIIKSYETILNLMINDDMTYQLLAMLIGAQMFLR